MTCGKGVLRLEQCPECFLYLRTGVVLIQDGQESCQFVGIVADLRDMQAVFIVPGIFFLYLRDLSPEFRFHRPVVFLSAPDIIIRGGKCRTEQGLRTALDEEGTGRHHSGYEHEKNCTYADDDERGFSAGFPGEHAEQPRRVATSEEIPDG